MGALRINRESLEVLHVPDGFEHLAPQFRAKVDFSGGAVSEPHHTTWSRTYLASTTR